MGKQPDNDDLAAAKVAVSEAKKLSPKHETVSFVSFCDPDPPMSSGHDAGSGFYDH